MKFLKNLTATNENIKKARAATIARQAEREQDKLITEYEEAIETFEMELEKAQDLYPETTVDLVYRNDFDAKVWVATVQDIKLKIFVANHKLEIAKKTKEEWFSKED